MTKIIQINGHRFPVEEIAFVSSVFAEDCGNNMYSTIERKYVYEKVFYRFYIKLKNDFTIYWDSEVVGNAHVEPAATERKATETTRQRIIDFIWPDAETLIISNQ
jgi:hypothetical protein